MDGDYVRNLENIIKQMLRPLKDIPLSLVIESISGHRIIPFNSNDGKDKALLPDLIEAAKLAGSNMNKKGISRPRPNEVGNDIEPFVKEALTRYGYVADTPITKEGNRKAMDYPDIEFVDKLIERITWSAKHTTEKIFLQRNVRFIYHHPRISRSQRMLTILFYRLKYSWMAEWEITMYIDAENGRFSLLKIY